MNTVALIGRLVRDPELRATTNGTPVCAMRIAVDRMGRNDDPGFVNVTAFGASGKACAEVLSQGWLVGVDGRLDFHEWTPDGSDQKRSEIGVIGRVEFLAAPLDRDAAPAPTEATAEPVGVGAGVGDDDIPF